jgi:acyl-CoA thioester hydrolase
MDVKEFKSSVSVPVRFSDIDSLGHVNNAVYLSYFEESRVHYFRELLKLPVDESARIGIIVREIRCVFKLPVYYGKALNVFSRVSWMRNRSMEMQYLVAEPDDGRIVAEGSSILVAYDYAARRSVEIPESMREKISIFEKIPLKVE